MPETTEYWTEYYCGTCGHEAAYPPGTPTAELPEEFTCECEEEE